MKCLETAADIGAELLSIHELLDRLVSRRDLHLKCAWLQQGRPEEAAALWGFRLVHDREEAGRLGTSISGAL